ncbi:MAG: hypothetical protein NPINA01_20780 [Nitrospinaceae bacterium]|nr:MAG: hypothetical protein NPINA01_20780 [Nitrospinaceae bacterium]
MSRLPFHFSIDFEDFTHDYKRKYGSTPAKMNVDLLWTSYEKIKSVLKDIGIQNGVTFFTTGILAKNAPDLVKQISDDGHEVGCHYYYHDSVYRDSIDSIAKNLDLAIETLTQASGQTIRGFRAPEFSIRNTDKDIYKEIAKRFEYDSSFVADEQQTADTLKDYFYSIDENLKEFPVYAKKSFARRMNYRSGGTFLKFFPVKMTVATMNEAHSRGFMPMVYIHPYELFTDAQFWVPWSELDSLPPLKRLKPYARQIQWLKVQNKTMIPKLKSICQQFEHQGPMRNLLS